MTADQTNLKPDHYQITKKVTIIGSVVDGVLGVLKVLVGLIGQSQALVADGAHSLSDLATDILVLWAAKHSHSGPDHNHPYGHERIETLATIALALALIAVAASFFYDAILRLLSPEQLQQPGSMVLIAAAISVLAKEAIYHYTMRFARQINSNLLRANAWHSRSDAASSIIVLLGVAGVMLGFKYADALASMGVSLMIGWVGWRFGREGIDELIDTSIDQASLNNMRQTIKGVEGVVDVHQVRTRKMAGKIVMDAHITVAPKITVSEGHRIGDAVEQALHQQFDELADVTMHIDHEDDDQQRLGYHLPLRAALLEQMQMQAALASGSAEVDAEALSGLPQISEFDEIKLHYIAGSIHLEIWRQFKEASELSVLLAEEALLRQIMLQITEVSEVTVLYRIR